jgi:transposase-like protein
MVKKTKHLDELEKIHIVALYERGDLSKTSISKKVGRGWKTTNRWINRVHEAHTITERKHTGRKPVLTKKAGKVAYKLLANNGRMSATHVAHRLFKDKLSSKLVSRTTVVRAAQHYAKDQCLPKVVANWSKPKRRLSELNRQLRLQFCNKNKKMDWASVMFTDRCKFTLKYPGVHMKRKIWRKKGQPYEEYYPTKPSAMYNVYGGITMHGPTKLITVTGTTGVRLRKNYKTKRQATARSITQSEYKDVAMQLLAQGYKLFKGKPWRMLQDNDKAHKGADEAFRLWGAQHPRNACLLKFPPNSPDLNLIENVWGYILPKVEAAGCTSSKQFQSKVEKEFAALPDAYIQRLFMSMPSRIQECIRKGGDRTAH